MTHSSSGSTTQPLTPEPNRVHRAWCASVVYNVQCGCCAVPPYYEVVHETQFRPTLNTLTAKQVTPSATLVTLDKKPGYVDLDY